MKRVMTDRKTLQKQRSRLKMNGVSFAENVGEFETVWDTS